ncbi:MAG: glycosyltransferase family 2 protein [Alcanivorax sp.]
MNNKDYPLITICISCYNSADTVQGAIESALTQDWPNKEILIGDDGSSDNTVEVVRNAIEGHENARLIVYESNKGFAGSLNTLIAEAKGAFMAIFDDDDKSLPERIRRQYERIVEYEKTYNTNMVICHVARLQHFQNGYERYEKTMGTRGGIAPNGQAVADRILTGRLSHDVVGSCANCSRMARLEVFQKMGGYNDKMTRGEDTEFNVRFSLAGGHFVGIAEPLVIQTMTMGREKTLAEERKAERFVIEKNKEYLMQAGWYDFCVAWLNVRHEHLNDNKVSLFLGLFRLFLRYPVKVIQKIIWSMPARRTREDFRKWHQQEFNKNKAV